MADPVNPDRRVKDMAALDNALMSVVAGQAVSLYTALVDLSLAAIGT